MQAGTLGQAREGKKRYERKGKVIEYSALFCIRSLQSFRVMNRMYRMTSTFTMK